MNQPNSELKKEPKKEPYIPPVIEIIEFTINDSIATSSDSGAMFGEEIWQG